MKISAIELYHVSVPLKETFWPTWIPGYPQTHNRFTLIKIVTDEGITGYSAGTALGKERQELGFEIDEGLLRKYGKRFFKITETRLKLKVIREKGIKTALNLKKRKDSQ